jgi:hypothetical protein
MLIGLYSVVSRGNFAALWNNQASPGPGADDYALRRYRRNIMERRPGGSGNKLLVSRGFRDLVLHVSERQCALPDIRQFLDEAGLAFHGFRLPPEIQEGFFRSSP